MNLFIVESPLQLLCAHEAIQQFDDADYLLLVRLTGRGNNDLHLLNCAKFLQLRFDVFLLRPDHFAIDFLKNAWLWLKLLTKSFEHVFFGSVYSNALNVIKRILRFKTLFYLDDGAATLRAQTEMRHGQMGQVNWFTFFKLEPIADQLVQEHTFEKLREYKRLNELKHRYFIGQPVEGMIGFTEDDYLTCVRHIASLCTQLDPLIYIPHRVESANLLQKVSEIAHVKVIHLDSTIEMYFVADCLTAPLAVYSCYSTALVTLKTLFPKTLVYSIRKGSVQSDALGTVYKYFDKVGIESLDA